jgi:hypothetical protein
VKTLLQRIFVKTGTSRQSQLTRLVLMSTVGAAKGSSQKDN